MRSPERESTPFLFGHDHLHALLEIGELLGAETKMLQPQTSGMELDTRYEFQPNEDHAGTGTQTVSIIRLFPANENAYELQVFTQEVETKSTDSLTPRDHWNDPGLISWRDTRLYIPSNTDGRSLIRVKEETYFRDFGEEKITTKASYRLSPENHARIHWLNAVSHRVLQSLREKILAYESLSSASALYNKIAAFAHQYGKQRLTELSRTPQKPSVELRPVLVSTRPHGTLMLPKILITSHGVGAVARNHYVVDHASVYVEPHLFDIEAPAPIPITTPHEAQQELLTDFSGNLAIVQQRRDQTYDLANELIVRYTEHCHELYPNDLSMLGTVSALHLFYDHASPVEDEPLIQTSEIKRVLADDTRAVYRDSGPWSDTIRPHQTAHLILGIFHSPQAGDIL